MSTRKWEYVVVAESEGKGGTGSTQRLLNELGNEGWELVSVTEDAEGPAYMWFKRRCSVPSRARRPSDSRSSRRH